MKKKFEVKIVIIMKKTNIFFILANENKHNT